MLMSLLTLSLLSAAAVPETDSSLERDRAPSAWAARINLGFSNLQPYTGGVALERRLTGHVSVSVGVGLSYVGFGYGESTSFGGSPALRYYTRRVFEGVWFELAGSLGATASPGSFGALGGLGSLGGVDASPRRTIWTIRYGASVSLGYTFYWDNGLLLSLSGGPSLGIARSRQTNNSMVSFGIQGAASVGIAF